MIALAVLLIIALVLAFLVLDRRALRVWSPDPKEAEPSQPAARMPEDLERDIYRELYAERSGQVSRRGAGPRRADRSPTA